MMNDVLTGKVALITGAASGLGLVLAEALAEVGARVAVTDLDGQAALAAAARLSDRGEAIGLALDVADDEAVERGVAAAVDAFGGIDILVNNAGLARGRWNLCSELESSEWHRILAVNVAAPARIARACRPHLRARGGGVIVNQSSMGAYAALNSAYSISKLALSALTVALADEFSGDNIRVNGIAPGMMTSRLPPAIVEQVLARQLIKRSGTPADLIGALLFLCSDASSFVSGQTIIVDGGVARRV